MTPHRPFRLLHRLSTLETHHRFGFSLLMAFLAFMALWKVRLPVRIIVSWDAYSATLVALAWSIIVTAKPRAVVRLAKLTHTSRKFVVGFVVVAACASLMAVAFLLGSAKGLHQLLLLEHVGLAVATIVLSWLTVHTIFTMHYAFLYYRPPFGGETSRKPGGLIFPEPTEPDYLDFAYFSFVIGMTSQVSDVQIGGCEIRRWALLHGVVSFGFNTAVLALSLNILSGLF